MTANPSTTDRRRQERATQQRHDPGIAIDSIPPSEIRKRSPRDGTSPQRQKPRRARGTGQTLLERLVLDIDEAMEEITRVPAAEIHRDAAFAWASRAIAGYRVCAAKSSVQEGLSYLYLGEHYREAALAHAAMGEAWQPLFTEIDDAMADDRAIAFGAMRGRSPVATK